MALSGVPVKIFGVTVGSAHINDDGTFDLNMDANQLGMDLMQRLEAGEYSGLSILPEGVDSPPATEAVVITPARGKREKKA